MPGEKYVKITRDGIEHASVSLGGLAAVVIRDGDGNVTVDMVPKVDKPEPKVSETVNTAADAQPEGGASVKVTRPAANRAPRKTKPKAK